MPKGLKRYYGHGHLHFLTFRCYRRLPLLNTFYGFNVWSGKKMSEKLDYMHANPVKRKLVTHPKDWPWSSWSFYASGEPGLIPIDHVGH